MCRTTCIFSINHSMVLVELVPCGKFTETMFSKENIPTFWISLHNYCWSDPIFKVTKPCWRTPNLNSHDQRLRGDVIPNCYMLKLAINFATMPMLSRKKRMFQFHREPYTRLLGPQKGFRQVRCVKGSMWAHVGSYWSGSPSPSSNIIRDEVKASGVGWQGGAAWIPLTH